VRNSSSSSWARPCSARGRAPSAAASGDPRLSIEDRNPSRASYLEPVRQAGRELCARGYLLEEDIELSITLAARMWDYRRPGSRGRPALQALTVKPMR
jgi:hypothetical protein